jgi:hypothetical protein
VLAPSSLSLPAVFSLFDHNDVTDNIEQHSAKVVKLATRRTGVETERSDFGTEVFVFVCFADPQSTAHLSTIRSTKHRRATNHVVTP